MFCSERQENEKTWRESTSLHELFEKKTWKDTCTSVFVFSSIRARKTKSVKHRRSTSFHLVFDRKGNGEVRREKKLFHDVMGEVGRKRNSFAVEIKEPLRDLR